MATLVDGMVRASMLDTRLYEEVEADTNATGQALTVVVISSAAAGIGGLGGGVTGFIVGIIGSLIGWAIWAGLIYLIGTKILPEPQTKSDWGELLRTLGFASAPGVLRVLGIIPFIGWIINLAIGIWMLVTMVVAVRTALDYESTPRAVGVCFIGWIVMMLLTTVFAAVFVGASVATGALS